MKLFEITKFVKRIQQSRSEWEYDQIQIELLEGINRDVDGFHLANIILKKYMDHKSKPTIDQIEKVIHTMKIREDSEVNAGCDKCREGFITVFNSKIWEYDTGIQDYISHHGWDPDQLESIFMLPVMDISCGCSNKKRLVKISSYLKWLEKFNFIAQEFFEVCYIQLYLFYSQTLERSLSFDEFDPFAFWGHIPEHDMTFTLDSIINQKLKDMLSDVENGGMGVSVRESLRKLQQGVRILPKSGRELL